MGRAKPYDSSSKSWNDILGKPLNIPMNQREYSWTDKEIKQFSILKKISIYVSYP